MGEDLMALGPQLVDACRVAGYRWVKPEEVGAAALFQAQGIEDAFSLGSHS
jgi:hypothetical protein